MAIEQGSGGTLLTNGHTLLMRYASLKVGLGMEERTQGRMQLTRGPSCKKRVLDEFKGETALLKQLGIKLNRNTSYADLILIVQAKADAVAATQNAIESAAA